MLALLTPNAKAEAFFLSKVSYLEAQREIIAEFSNLHEKRIERFKFFPKAFYNFEGKSFELVKEILSLYDRKRFKLSKLNSKICEIHASTFTDLKKISNLLKQSLKQGLQILEPEKQFLLEKKLQYFEAFKPSQFCMEKTTNYSIPELKAEFCEESLEKTIKQLIKHDRKTLQHFLEAFALSKKLCVPMQSVPESQKAVAELFLENALFNNSFQNQKSSIFNNQAFEESASGFFKNVLEIDFSQVWAWLFSSQNYNIGFETLNCKCCKPESIAENNILPNSKVEARLLQNGLYYTSENPGFALEFHNSRENKKARFDRMKEWFLKTLPVGPFKAGEKCLLPVSDALALQSMGKAEVLQENSELEWYCKKKESFIAREIQTLILDITRNEDTLLRFEHDALTAHKVLCSFQLSETPEYLIAYYEKHALENLLKNLLKELNNPFSRFYSEKLAQALKAVQCQKISQFKQVAKEAGEKILQSSPEAVLVQAENPTVLVKEFAKKAKTPTPSIRHAFKQLILT